MNISILETISVVTIVALVLLNMYQFLIQRSAVRVSKGLFVISSNVIEKAKEIRVSGKDIEIVEAHLLDIHTLVGMLLSSLRAKEKIELSSFLYTHQQNHVDPLTKDWEEDSVFRSAEDIVRNLIQEHGEWEMSEIVDTALDQFVERVPNMERESARRIVDTVVKRNCIIGVKWGDESGISRMAEALGRI